MKRSINVEYNDASTIIDAGTTFISFDQRYASKGYPIPCELYLELTPEIEQAINQSGIVKIDSDFTYHNKIDNVYKILLVPLANYQEQNVITFFSDLLLRMQS